MENTPQTPPNTYTPAGQQSNMPSVPQQYVYSAPATPAAPAPTKAKKRRHPRRPIEIALLAIALALFIMTGLLTFVIAGVGGTLGAFFSTPTGKLNPPANTFSVINVEGTIQSGATHDATVSYIKQLTKDEGNKGILLYMNTGGGSVYESDEVYRSLLEYKQETKRPVWAYMGPTCASGGYYICMAADNVVANYNTTTGSIGVYIMLMDTSGMYESFGVKTILIKAGENKAMGADGVPVTEEHEQIFQSLVDESYNQFVSLVAKGRKMEDKEVRKLADGRPYTAQQALNNGLVDEVNSWDDVLLAFEEETGATAYQASLAQQSGFSSVMGQVKESAPKSDNQALLELTEQALPSGIPLAYAPGLH